MQKPHPPIWVGGHSRAALRRTVEFGAAWHPINRPPDELRAGQAELARLCQARGRATPPALTLRNDIRVLRSGQSAPASSHGGRVMAGEPAALVDQIGELADCGVEHLVLEFLAADGRELDEQLTTFAERVRPRARVSRRVRSPDGRAPQRQRPGPRPLPRRAWARGGTGSATSSRSPRASPCTRSITPRTATRRRVPRETTGAAYLDLVHELFVEMFPGDAPLRFAGFSFGGAIAANLARRLAPARHPPVPRLARRLPDAPLRRAADPQLQGSR